LEPAAKMAGILQYLANKLKAKGMEEKQKEWN